MTFTAAESKKTIYLTEDGRWSTARYCSVAEFIRDNENCTDEVRRALNGERDVVIGGGSGPAFIIDICR